MRKPLATIETIEQRSADKQRGQSCSAARIGAQTPHLVEVDRSDTIHKAGGFG